jgi:hypothetical protein
MDQEEVSNRVFLQALARRDPSGRRYSGRRRLGWLGVWLLLTLALDCLQFLVFDCSEMPILSLLFGLPTFGAVAALPMLLVENWSHESRPLTLKLLVSVLETAGLLAIACLAGFFMLFTHLCP